MELHVDGYGRFVDFKFARPELRCLISDVEFLTMFPPRRARPNGLSYAPALDTREPLLWKGEDFGHTGIVSALKR